MERGGECQKCPQFLCNTDDSVLELLVKKVETIIIVF